MWRALPLIVLIACGNKNNTPTPPEEGTPADGAADAGTPAPAPEPVPEPAPTAPPTPQSLYEECKERVESRNQAPGECKADADCKTAGCGAETCTTAADAANIMSTCEDKLCFKVLDTCGCHEGMCTWTLKAEVPALPMTPPAPLPPNRLPPTPPPPAGGG